MKTLDRATRLLGGRAQLMEVLGIDSPAYRYWVRKESVPAHQALRIEYLTKGRVRAKDLYSLGEWADDYR